MSRTDKGPNFLFCMHIDRNKWPLRILGKVAAGVARTVEIQGTRILRASRGRLYDSSAFLFHFLTVIFV